MGEGSRRWLLAAALIAGGAALATAAVTLYWRPCVGSRVPSGGFDDYRIEPGFTKECLAAMDRAPIFPLPEPGAGWTLVGALGALAAILLAAAWLVLLPALRLPRSARFVTVLPGVLGLALVAESVVASFIPAVGVDLLRLALMALSALSVPMAALALEDARVPRPLVIRATVVALAATATGMFYHLADYLVAMALSDADWDTPPGAGYFTVAVLALTAIATGVFGWLDGRPARTESVPAREATLR